MRNVEKYIAEYNKGYNSEPRRVSPIWTEETKELVKISGGTENSFDGVSMFDLINNCFKFGFMAGMKYEKNRKKVRK